MSVRGRMRLRSRETCFVGTKIRSIFVVLVMLAVPLIASAQWNESVLYSFQGGTDGVYPSGDVLLDKAGNLYGATIHTDTCVGTFDCGSVFELTPPAQQGALGRKRHFTFFRAQVRAMVGRLRAGSYRMQREISMV